MEIHWCTYYVRASLILDDKHRFWNNKSAELGCHIGLLRVQTHYSLKTFGTKYNKGGSKLLSISNPTTRRSGKHLQSGVKQKGVHTLKTSTVKTI